MPISEAKLRANIKWDKAHYAALTTKVKIADAERFRAICAAQGTTVNKVLSDYVSSYIAQHENEIPADTETTGTV